MSQSYKIFICLLISSFAFSAKFTPVKPVNCKLEENQGRKVNYIIKAKSYLLIIPEFDQ